MHDANASEWERPWEAKHFEVVNVHEYTHVVFSHEHNLFWRLNSLLKEDFEKTTFHYILLTLVAALSSRY